MFVSALRILDAANITDKLYIVEYNTYNRISAKHAVSEFTYIRALAT